MKEKLKRLFDNKTTHGKIMRLILVIVLLAAICGIVYIILRVTGGWEKVNSVDKIRAIVEKGGAFSFIIFIIFQILQTTILQIPSLFVTVAGAIIFGRWEAFFMSYAAVMFGSIIMFWIGRKAGRKFLNWMIGKETAEKWIDKMSGGKYLFFLMMLFPCFPDDILCVIAGLTNMSFSFFFWTNILARGLGIFCAVFFGSGAIIPFHGWGLVVWGIIIVIIAILFYLSIRFKDKIDEILHQMFSPKKAAKAINNSNDNKENLTNVNKENLTSTKENKENLQTNSKKIPIQQKNLEESVKKDINKQKVKK